MQIRSKFGFCIKALSANIWVTVEIQTTTQQHHEGKAPVNSIFLNLAKQSTKREVVQFQIYRAFLVGKIEFSE